MARRKKKKANSPPEQLEVKGNTPPGSVPVSPASPARASPATSRPISPMKSSSSLAMLSPKRSYHRLDYDVETSPISPRRTGTPYFLSQSDGGEHVKGKGRVHILITDIVTAMVVRSEEERVANNYNKGEISEELLAIVSKLGYDPIVHRVTLENYQSIIDTFDFPNDTVLNLCHGSDVDGIPGPTVASYLETVGAFFAGSSSRFRYLCSHKGLVKEILRRHKVNTPGGVTVTSANSNLVKLLALNVSYPLFIKPADTDNSVGIHADSLCHTLAAAQTKVTKMLETYSEVLVEEFVAGREFVVLVLGEARIGKHVFSAVSAPSEPDLSTTCGERIFENVEDPAMMFVTFEHEWGDSEENYHVERVTDEAIKRTLAETAKRAYIALGGNGFARVDLRMDEDTGAIYVLEVNASPHISNNTVTLSLLALYGKDASTLLGPLLAQAEREMYHPPTLKEVTVDPGEAMVGYNEAVATRDLFREEAVTFLQRLPVLDEPQGRHVVTKADGEYIDLSTTPEICAIKHSCNPNLRIRFSDWTIVTRRRCYRGEPLTLNYLLTEFLLPKDRIFQCLCGSDGCYDEIKGFKYLSWSQQRWLQEHDWCSPFVHDQAVNTSTMFADPVSVHVLVAGIISAEKARSEEEHIVCTFQHAKYVREMREAVQHLGYRPKIHEIFTADYQKVVDSFNRRKDIVLDLCRGSDGDGFPGPSVAKYLEETGQTFAGCNSIFMYNCKDKPHMKELFLKHAVRTPNGIVVARANSDLESQTSVKSSWPLIIKPADSYGSAGIHGDSVARTLAAAQLKVSTMLGRFPRLLVEEFVMGREFVVLVQGNSFRPGDVLSSAPLERVFEEGVSPEDRFVTFEGEWIDHRQRRFHYAGVDDRTLSDRLIEQAWRAYTALQGNGFGLVDIRLQEGTEELYVLEVNAPIHLGDNTVFSNVLANAGTTQQQFLQSVLDRARREMYHPLNLRVFDHEDEGRGNHGVIATMPILTNEVLLFLAKLPKTRELTKHCIQKDEDLFLDATMHPLVSRMKHSCEPNIAINFEDWTMRAVRPIEQGEELCYNYLTANFKMAKPFTCRCGSASCFKIIEGFEKLPPESQMNLLRSSPNAVAPYIQMASRHVVSDEARGKICVNIMTPDIISVEEARSQMEAIANNYGKEKFYEEMEALVASLGFKAKLRRTRLSNYKGIIDEIAATETDVVLNLCDGSDMDGFPGPSIARYLEDKGVAFAGCTSPFIYVTTHKGCMKELFRRYNVPTPKGVRITRNRSNLKASLPDDIAYPLFVKPADSYGSVGLTKDSVCNNLEAAQKQVNKMLETFPSLLVEEFIKGREFTVLVAGDSRYSGYAFEVYPPAERVFPSKDPNLKFVSFDMNWGGPSYEYIRLDDPPLSDRLMEVTRRAYNSVGGNGYGRVDIRMHEDNGNLYVLEVNAMCGVGNDSSSDSLLKLYHRTTREFLGRVVPDYRREVHLPPNWKVFDAQDDSGETSMVATRMIYEHEVIAYLEDLPKVEVYGPKCLTLREGSWVDLSGLPFLQSCEPNVAFHPPDLTLRTNVTINPGELLTFDFATTEWDMPAPLACNCELDEDVCRGDCRGFRFLTRAQQERLLHQHFVGLSPAVRELFDAEQKAAGVPPDA